MNWNMLSMSFTARAVRLTRYRIFTAHLLEYFGCRTGAAFPDIFEALADAFVHVGGSRDVEEAMVFGCALDDGFGFAVDGEDDGAARLRANALMR
jgi:hypothetical protein